MNYQALIVLLATLQFVWTIGVTWYSWSTRRQVTSSRWLKKIEDDVEAIEKRVTTMEADAKHAPTHGDIDALGDRLYNQINSMRQDLSKLMGGVEGLTNQFGLINEHLLRGNR